MGERDNQYWKDKLTPEQYEVLRLKGTEASFSGKYFDSHDKGIYSCAACGKLLFASETKFDSGTGWPSFTDVATKGTVEIREDRTYRLARMEVTCAKCGSHLGHLFNDGPKETGGKRYCINSCSLDFKPKH